MFATENFSYETATKADILGQLQRGSLKQKSSLISCIKIYVLRINQYTHG